MAQLGVLTSEFERADLAATLQAVVDNGIPAIQLQLGSAVTSVDLRVALRDGLGVLGEYLTVERCEEVGQLLRTSGLTVSAVDGTFNMVDPDARRRDRNAAHLRRLIALCPTLSTTTVTLCTGSRDPVMWRRHPDNDSPAAWEDLVAVLGPVVACAEDHGVVLAFEPEINNVVSSAARARRLLDEIGSPALQVVLDPANIFAAGELPNMREKLVEIVDLLGTDMALAHAKDLDRDGDAGHLGAGRGVLDYDLYLSLLQRSGFDGTIVLHQLRQLDGEEIAACFAFVCAHAPAGYLAKNGGDATARPGQLPGHQPDRRSERS